jgi:hypothetical protein
MTTFERTAVPTSSRIIGVISRTRRSASVVFIFAKVTQPRALSMRRCGRLNLPHKLRTSRSGFVFL